ncbi:MAG: hypothetical protein A2X84_09445 [Desulfuromonadaceae bacterium GWC2_58_13]|nr:MAG: hypothetical protein A2X84_09445 [Desulfuromonadaceae bacterium GWC2_58_13]
MIEALGRNILNLMQTAGEMVKLFAQTVFYFKEVPRNLPSIFRQLAEVGIGTLPVASVLALFVGMVLALQTGSELALYGSQEAIGAIVGLSMVKELGPVMTCLLVAGRVGSSMAAEVGAMQVYEEIDALKTLEISPIRYLAMPRLLACLLAAPALVIFSMLIGIAGGAFISDINPAINVPYNVYYENMVRAIGYLDIVKGIVKATVFGGIVAHVGCYVGFKTRGGARGIGQSTTRAVVMSFLIILVADYFLSRLMM